MNNYEEYEKQIWANLPDQTTPLSADRLNHMEDGIKKTSQELVNISNSLTDFYTILDISFSLTIVPPNASIWDTSPINISSQVPSGYNPVGIVVHYLTGDYHADCSFASLFINNKTIYYEIRNNNQSHPTSSLAAHIFVLCLKDS